MATEYIYYKKVNSELAFLAGVTSTLCDDKIVPTCPQYWHVEADVFYATDMEIRETIKERLLQYNFDMNEKVVNKIKELNFELEEVKLNFSQIISNLFSFECMNLNNRELFISDFIAELEYQLGEYKSIYRIRDDMNGTALSDFYTYIVFEVLFIYYDKFIVMLVFGSNE